MTAEQLWACWWQRGRIEWPQGAHRRMDGAAISTPSMPLSHAPGGSRNRIGDAVVRLGVVCSQILEQTVVLEEQLTGVEA